MPHELFNLLHVLDHVIFERKPRPWAVRARRACVDLYQRLAPFGRRPGDLVPEPLPPGTASAIATMMQEPPRRMPFVNSNTSTWMLGEYARQQHAAHVATASTMYDTPYNFALYNSVSQ